MPDRPRPEYDGYPSSDDATWVQALLDAGPDLLVPVANTGRVVGVDLDGEAGGTPVVLVHGTPDSRLARHPAAGIVTEVGVRLICVDRPGFGHSTIDPDATPVRFADDVAAVLDHLGIASAHLVAWSAGTIWAVGVAAALADRVRSVTAVGALVPFEAFDDPAVRGEAGAARLGMIETAEELGATIAAELIAPMLVPDPATPANALEHRRESDDHDLARVPGADAQMAAACCDAVRAGPAGLVRDVTVQLGDSGVTFDDITVPTRFLTGAQDTTCPPAFARWYADRIPGATAEIVDDAAHGLLLTHWRDVLSGLATA